MADSLQFDEPSLIARLAKLPNELRVAFAALCAERQLPNYIRFSATSDLGNPNVLKEALGSIWEDIQGRSVSNAQLESILERCMALIPNGSEDTEEETAYADDAAASVAYTLRARLAGDPQEAAWAARRAYESVDHFILSQLNSTIVRRDREAIIALTPWPRPNSSGSRLTFKTYSRPVLKTRFRRPLSPTSGIVPAETLSSS